MSGHKQTAEQGSEPAGSGEHDDAAGAESALPLPDRDDQCGPDSFPASDPPSSWWGGTGDPSPANLTGRDRDDRHQAGGGH